MRRHRKLPENARAYENNTPKILEKTNKERRIKEQM
jgi:hypothetical protein